MHQDFKGGLHTVNTDTKAQLAYTTSREHPCSLGRNKEFCQEYQVRLTASSCFIQTYEAKLTESVANN